jgi:hypothetical protein
MGRAGYNPPFGGSIGGGNPKPFGKYGTYGQWGAVHSRLKEMMGYAKQMPGAFGKGVSKITGYSSALTPSFKDFESFVNTGFKKGWDRAGMKYVQAGRKRKQAMMGYTPPPVPPLNLPPGMKKPINPAY